MLKGIDLRAQGSLRIGPESRLSSSRPGDLSHRYVDDGDKLPYTGQHVPQAPKRDGRRPHAPSGDLRIDPFMEECDSRLSLVTTAVRIDVPNQLAAILE